jgi:septum formation protein
MATQEAIILASASPRRRELLARLDVPFSVEPSNLPEPSDRPAHVTPPAWAESLAYFKARSIAERRPGVWVLGADTIVVCGDAVLGKPRDRDHARRMLHQQAGRISAVITGLAFVRRAGADFGRLLDHDVSLVSLRDDPATIETYLASGAWCGKAGAYGIQDVGDQLVDRIEGSFDNIVGLPTERLVALLDTLGLRRAPAVA